MKKSIGIFLLMVLMLLHADYVTEGARYGLLLWYSSVVPALFPFMVLSSLLVAGGGISILMKPFSFLFTPLLGLSDSGCYALVSGLLCGCPMGAKTTADFLRNGQITLKEGKLLMAICNHPSPMFLLGYVYPFFADILPLWKLLLAVYGPLPVIAAAALFLYGRSEGGETSGTELCPENAASSLDNSILSAVEVLCKIGGCLMLYSIVIVFLRHASFLSFQLRLLLTASMEMTTGIREAAVSLHFPASAAAAVAALTFSGFSGVSQTAAVLESKNLHAKKAGLSIRPYIFWKLLHSFLSAGTLLFLCSLPM